MDMWNKLNLDAVINEALEHLLNVGAPLQFMRIPSPSAARSYLASFHDVRHVKTHVPNAHVVYIFFMHIVK